MKVNRAGLRKHVSVKLEREEEDQSYEADFSDEETIKWVREQLEMGNPWAWFCAKVTVTFCGFESEQYLGGCSYESELNFRNDAYFEQLVGDGVEEIADALESIGNEHDLWEHDEVTCLWCAARPILSKS